jgi:hypothetical protein
MAHVHTITPEQLAEENVYLQGKGKQLGIILGIAGAVLVGVGAILTLGGEGGLRRFLFAYLTGFVYIASLSLGGLFFTLLQHLTRAAWSVVIRRIAEVVASNLLWVFLLGLFILIPILAGNSDIYIWLAPDAAHDPLIAHKAAWLNKTAFALRFIGYFAFWTWLSWHLLRTSVKQDATGDAKLTLGLWRLSAPCMLAFALTLTFFMVDMVMTLDPQWFSTMIGVYYFAGCMLSFMSVLAMICLLLQSSGRLKHAITTEHYHDFGKLMFAFVFFWGYIAFSQFMLMWYGNIPEEIHWFARREAGTVPGTFGFLAGWEGGLSADLRPCADSLCGTAQPLGQAQPAVPAVLDSVDPGLPLHRHVLADHARVRPLRTADCARHGSAGAGGCAVLAGPRAVVGGRGCLAPRPAVARSIERSAPGGFTSLRQY